MKFFSILWLAVALTVMAGCKTGDGSKAGDTSSAWTKSWRAANPVWRGIHISVQSNRQAEDLVEQMPRLAGVGVNVIIAEVDYCYEFESHPELRSERYVSKANAHRVAEAARAQGIRIIPQINCLGHQSWSSSTLPLLVKYPQFDEAPGQYPNNKDIYCRSWCPQNPEVNTVVFALVDELLDGFEADAFNVGMDEVFIIGSEYCPRCKGRDPAKLFAKAVKDFHHHLVDKRHAEMLMWGDRLLDAKRDNYSEWEASTNHTAPAIDMIPKDIIICDWHYGNKETYVSVPLLLCKGFRVWPSGWQPLEATKSFSAYAKKQQNPRLIGYLCTTWGRTTIPHAAEWPPIVEVLRDWH